ncbi:hypothetical protein J132_03109 [Termitomyces sp. J132]|nr:hypothetical protein C0989_003625 [Termitomyces sp. Mn162]KNZ81117.1 hypothetical protein J132_03109 [Termitomyces sp. J132]
MNSHPHHFRPRSRSLPPRPTGRSRSRNLAHVIAALEKVKIQRIQEEASEKKLAFAREKLQNDPPRPQFLMPRVEIIDDMNQERLVVKLEIPDVDPSKVNLKLHGNVLSVFGERTPDLSAVAEEYRDGLRFHSQTDMGSHHRPKVILLGGGRVASLLSTQVHVPSNLKQSSSQTRASPPPGHVRAERIHYNELRYGAFCRNLRIPASDIEGHFTNGMLVLSWPKVQVPTEEESLTEEDVNISIPSSTPVTVKAEEMEIDSSL